MAKMGRPATGLISVMIRIIPKLLARVDRAVKIKKRTSPELNRSKYICEAVEEKLDRDEKAK